MEDEEVDPRVHIHDQLKGAKRERNLKNQPA